MATEEYIDAEIDPNTGLAMVTEAKVVSAPLDSFADVIQEKFQEAREYRRDNEVHWYEAYNAYRGKYPAPIGKSTELAKERVSLSTRPAGKSTQLR